MWLFFSAFQTAEAVLDGARHMLAMRIARQPMVRHCVRQAFFDRAKLNIVPTKKGKKVRQFSLIDFFKYFL